MRVTAMVSVFILAATATWGQTPAIYEFDHTQVDFYSKCPGAEFHRQDAAIDYKFSQTVSCQGAEIQITECNLSAPPPRQLVGVVGPLGTFGLTAPLSPLTVNLRGILRAPLGAWRASPKYSTEISNGGNPTRLEGGQFGGSIPFYATSGGPVTSAYPFSGPGIGVNYLCQVYVDWPTEGGATAGGITAEVAIFQMYRMKTGGGPVTGTVSPPGQPPTTKFTILGEGCSGFRRETGAPGRIQCAARSVGLPDPSNPVVYQWQIDGRMEPANRGELRADGFAAGVHTVTVTGTNGGATTPPFVTNVTVDESATGAVTGTASPQTGSSGLTVTVGGASQQTAPGQNIPVKLQSSESAELRASCEAFRDRMALLNLKYGGDLLNRIANLQAAVDETFGEGATLQIAAILRAAAICGKVLSQPSGTTASRSAVPGVDNGRLDVNLTQGPVLFRSSNGGMPSLIRTSTSKIEPLGAAEFLVAYNPESQNTLVASLTGSVRVSNDSGDSQRTLMAGQGVAMTIQSPGELFTFPAAAVTSNTSPNASPSPIPSAFPPARPPLSGGTPLVLTDELHLRSGTVLTGKLIAADEKTIVFKTQESLLTKSRDEVQKIVLGENEIRAGALPPGLSVAQGLNVTHWVTFRRITNFQGGPDAKIMNNSKISADGLKIIFSTYAGTYVINADGSSLIRLDDKRNEGYIDISSDAKKVVWYNVENGLVVANSDGSGRLKMPGGVPVEGLRMTARGDRLFILSGDFIYTLPTDGSGINRVVNTTQVAQVAGTDANGNHWRRGPWSLDIADDGSRLVFRFLWDAFAMNGDGSGLRKVTDFGRVNNQSLDLVSISGDGRKIAYHNVQPERTITVMDWNGGNPLVYSGSFADFGGWMQFSRDAGVAALSWGLRLFSGDHREFWGVDDIGDVGTPIPPLNRAAMATMSGDHKRICLQIEGPESRQLVIVEIDPPSINGTIPLANIDISPRFLLNDGNTQAVVSAQISDTNLQYAGAMPRREGMRLRDWGNSGSNLPMRKSSDKAKASDNIFESEPLYLRTNSGTPVSAGPVTMRVFTVSKEGSVLIVEVDKVDARQP